MESPRSGPINSGKKVATSSSTACLDTELKAFFMSTLKTAKLASFQFSSMQRLRLLLLLLLFIYLFILLIIILHKLIRTIIEDTEYSQLLLNSWYLDDGVLSGTKSVIRRVVTLIQKLGPALGLWINPAKCELFSRTVLTDFPQEMKVSHEPNFEVLGAPIGDTIFVQSF